MRGEWCVSWCSVCEVFFLMIRRPPRSTQSRSSAASDVYKRQFLGYAVHMFMEGFSSRANLQILWFLIAMSMAMDQLIFQSRQKVKQGNPITITGLES